MTPAEEGQKKAAFNAAFLKSSEEFGITSELLAL